MKPSQERKKMLEPIVSILPQGSIKKIADNLNIEYHKVANMLHGYKEITPEVFDEASKIALETKQNLDKIKKISKQLQ